mmetsp:Transcript_12461/g.26526  ORF Transcript_12461/g.26526 Transcript_12461/m.26526 type:complete len:760 (+) Transcript_12461:115-2394(+)
MKVSLTLAILTLLRSGSKLSSAEFTPVAPVCESTFDYFYDSQDVSSASTTVAYEEGTPYIQLDLSQTFLSPSAKLFLTAEGGGTQELDATTLAQGNGFSAIFDGSSVHVELRTPGNIFRGNAATSRVVVTGITVGVCEDDIAESICGLSDDRVLSHDVRQGIMGGCTGWLIGEDVFIHAGHCGTPSSSTRLNFKYDNSANLAENQYAVDISSYKSLSTGVGKDWGAGRLFPNSSTGKHAGVAQGEKCGIAPHDECPEGKGWYTVRTVPSTPAGNHIRITGYGTADTNSRWQKTHMDDLVTVATNHLKYIPDTTGGNSGSPVIHEETGHAIGVHTHGGCGETGGSNTGTRIDRTDFAAHIEFLTKSCTQNSDCSDGIFCNGEETCDANGKCQLGTPPSCSDGLVCTDDICNTSTDTCNNPPIDCFAVDQACATGQCLEGQGGCEFTCGATLDTWTDIVGTSIASLRSGTNDLSNPPTTSVRLGSGDLLEGPTNVLNDYGSRMTGWLVAPVTGSYDFWMASDDNGEFWLSTDSDPANMVRICHVPSWSSSREWGKFPNDQQSDPISLVAGQAYYMEVLMKEGGGGDNLAVAWQYPGQTQTVIPASHSLMTRPEPEPTNNPTPAPTKFPTSPPTPEPTDFPSTTPTKNPTNPPTTANPTPPPTTANPTSPPTTANPTTANPTANPTTANPTANPTPAPTNFPTPSPTNAPTLSPTPAPTSPPTKACIPSGGPCPEPGSGVSCCSLTENACFTGNGAKAGTCK